MSSACCRGEPSMNGRAPRKHCNNVCSESVQARSLLRGPACFKCGYHVLAVCGNLTHKLWNLGAHAANTEAGAQESLACASSSAGQRPIGDGESPGDLFEFKVLSRRCRLHQRRAHEVFCRMRIHKQSRRQRLLVACLTTSAFRGMHHGSSILANNHRFSFCSGVYVSVCTTPNIARYYLLDTAIIAITPSRYIHVYATASARILPRAAKYQHRTCRVEQLHGGQRRPSRAGRTRGWRCSPRHHRHHRHHRCLHRLAC